MTNRAFAGFLVVLADPLEGGYVGVARVPPYRVPPYPEDHPEEQEGMYEYVLGSVKDFDTNLIPSIEEAQRLRASLERGGRKFEVILCCDSESDVGSLGLPTGDIKPLGYDVAGLESYSSIVDHWCPNDWAGEYTRHLNEHGLFRSRINAQEYLAEYVRRKEYYWDANWRVLFVARVAGP